MSKPEEKITALLQQGKYYFIREKTFEDLKRGKYRYDFYIPSLNALIEYNGEQHYQRIKYFHKTERVFKAAQERDRKKIGYALAQKMKLYIIPYWELENISTCGDIFQEKYKAKSQWHNDNTWRSRNSCK